MFLGYEACLLRLAIAALCFVSWEEFEKEVNVTVLIRVVLLSMFGMRTLFGMKTLGQC